MSIIQEPLTYPAGSSQLFLDNFGLIVSSGTNVVCEVDIIRAIPIIVKYKCTVLSASIRVTVAVAGSAIVSLYKYNKATGISTLVGQTDATTPFDLGVVSTQTIVFTSPIILSPGAYYATINCSSAAQIYGINGRDSSPTLWGWSATIGTTSDLMSGFEASTFSTTSPPTITPSMQYKSQGYNPFLLFNLQ